MTTAKERGAEVRRRLVAAAAEVVVERGWTAATTRVVAERAGVAPGLVHYHFESVQALLAEAVMTTARELTGQMTALLDTAEDAGDTVAKLVRGLDDFSGADPASVLLIEAFLAATRDERLRERLGAVITGLRDDLTDRFAGQGVPDPAGTAAVLLASVDGMMLHRGLLGPVDNATVLRRLVRS
ncbi:MAG: TetR family transcriptional regulator [Actinomycetota bacterium]|nr:TetR family transcriptional regulator [Actinomycetota bacterium]